MALKESLHRLPWPERLGLMSVVAGGVVWVRLIAFAEMSNLAAISLTCGLCVAWAGSTSAALLLGLTAVERLRKRPLSILRTPMVWRSLGLVGVGLTLAASTMLLLTWDVEMLTLLGFGVLAAGVALWLRGRPSRGLLSAVGLLVGAIVLFNAPREEGQISLRWNNVEHRSSWSGGGNENCTGRDLGDQPATIAAYRPSYVLEPSLSGSFGQMVSDRIGRPGIGEYPPGAAVVTLHGNIEHGDPGCYAPFVKSQTFRGNIQMTVSLNLEGRGEGGTWQLA